VKKVFVDTNILIDLIGNRKPFGKFAVALFELGEAGKIELYTSSHSIATIHYLLKKFVSDRELREILLELAGIVRIIAIDGDIIKRALNSKHKDFEDAVQIVAAQSIENMSAIVTRNLRDFKGAEIPVFSPDEFVSRASEL
jgi:predicted nucleic acid-binding protein